MGFTDAVIAKYIGMYQRRINSKTKRTWILLLTYKMVDTCAAEFEAVTPYYYSTYDEYCEVQ